MKSSNGLILYIFECQIDLQYFSLSKLTAFVSIVHGSITLSTKQVVSSDSLLKWNQIFYLEKQPGQAIEFRVFHRPLLLKDVLLGSCTLSLDCQSGWLHLFRDQRQTGSLKITLTQEVLPMDTSDIKELYYKRLAEVQMLKKKSEEYKEKYKEEKKEHLKNKPSKKLHELASTLKQEQENYIACLKEVNEAKAYLKSQEDLLISEKEKLRQERDLLSQTELEIKRTAFLLQSDAENLQQIRNKKSLQDRICKGSHRNTKSEGRQRGLQSSPYSRAKSKDVVPNSLSSFVL
jgi:hypothetical protein